MEINYENGKKKKLRQVLELDRKAIFMFDGHLYLCLSRKSCQSFEIEAKMFDSEDMEPCINLKNHTIRGIHHDMMVEPVDASITVRSITE